MTMPRIADSLAGRMEIIPLLRLAQSEIDGEKRAFLEQVFQGIPLTVRVPMIGTDLVEAVLGGGYPEALLRRSWPRKQDWHTGYVDAIMQRDVREIAQVEHLQQIPRLLRALAEHAGQLVNYSALGGALAMNHETTRRYCGILECLYLIRTMEPWFSNNLKRQTKTPKLHFLDSGLLAAMRGVTPDNVRRDRTAFGPVLETFVVSEILKLAGWAADRYRLSYFRDKDMNEVDIVIENRQGQVVGVEVKASATVRPADFSGIRRLAAACGDKFALGLVLYDSGLTVPFGDRMYAAPLSALR